MRRLLLPLLFGLGLVLAAHVRSEPGGATAGSTGAPMDGTCTASGCHESFPLNSGEGSVEILDVPAAVVPGQAYELRVRVNSASAARFGFQMTAMAAAGAFAGTFAPLDGQTRLADAGARYITHTLVGTGVDVWRVRWTAPATLGGPVTFYAAGNAANGDNTRQGDRIFTTQVTTAVASSAEGTAPPSAFRLERAFPNPAHAATTVAFTLHRAAPVVVTLFDAAGRRVQVHRLGAQAPGPHQVVLDVAALTPGWYHYEVRVPGARQGRPLLVVR